MGRDPGDDGSHADERWTPADLHPVERRPREDREAFAGSYGDDVRRWEPHARRRTPVWASAWLAIVLAALLLGLVAVAVVAPGLNQPAPSAAPVSPSPSASASAIAASPTASPVPTIAASATPLPRVIEVQVLPGDSLNSIARRYDTKARSIAFWNRDRYPSLDPESADYEPDQIQVGWTLVVYPGQIYAEAASAEPASASPSEGG